MYITHKDLLHKLSYEVVVQKLERSTFLLYFYLLIKTFDMAFYVFIYFFNLYIYINAPVSDKT